MWSPWPLAVNPGSQSNCAANKMKFWRTKVLPHKITWSIIEIEVCNLICQWVSKFNKYLYAAVSYYVFIMLMADWTELTVKLIQIESVNHSSYLTLCVICSWCITLKKKSVILLNHIDLMCERKNVCVAFKCKTIKFNTIIMIMWSLKRTIVTILSAFSILLSPNTLALLEFFLNSANSVTKICHYSKRTWTCPLLWKRPGCYHSTSKTHVRDRIFKLSPIHVSVIYEIP